MIINVDQDKRNQDWLRRPPIRKYSESQPRVPAGSPEGGQFAGGAGEPDPEALKGGLKAWVGHWFDDDLNPPYVKDYHEQIRQALAGESVAAFTSSVGGQQFSIPATPEVAQRYLEQGRALLQAVARAPSTMDPLYRGLKMTEEQKASFLSNIKVGGRLDLNLSSWSKDLDAAGKYTGAGLSGRFGSPRVLMEIVGDKQALDVGATPLPWEKEFLTDGRFTVLDVVERVAEQSPYRNTPNLPSPPMETVVMLQQESVFHDPAQTYGTKVSKLELGEARFIPEVEQFMDGRMITPDARKYREDQARDERGRFASEGGDITDTHKAAWDTVGERIDEFGQGNCYPAAYRLAADADSLGLTNVKVCHGTAVPRIGPLKGTEFTHAWVEADSPTGKGDRTAYDWSSGARAIMPAEPYRVLGGMKDVTEYTPYEAMIQAARTGHYGPWT